jgi:aspartate-semialdehyde dehydrogenase
MKRYSVVLVGIGLVGTRILQVLREREFPVGSIKVLARSTRTENIDGRDYEVVAASPDAFEGAELALFAGTEGARGASLQYGWEAVKRGCVVVDNGDDFRMDERVPLVIPEVNPEALRAHRGIVANPNCSTIQMVAALAPLHRAARIRRIVVSTYQAVSGTGGAAVAELERQVRDVPAGKPANPEQYPYPIFGNVIPQISTLKDIFPGYYGEEIKMVRETRKILGDPEIAVSATCVRVPVAFGHSESINVEFHEKLTAAEAREILSKSPGIKVIDDPAASKYPMPLDAAGKDEVFVGRIRDDGCHPNTLDLWCVSDNIRKGAATNAVQIAEKLIEMDLLRLP